MAFFLLVILMTKRTASIRTTAMGVLMYQVGTKPEMI